ncbi:MAG: hypothetical protein AAF479_08350, partial [Pseudomonadota bacterium]
PTPIHCYYQAYLLVGRNQLSKHSHYPLGSHKAATGLSVRPVAGFADLATPLATGSENPAACSRMCWMIEGARRACSGHSQMNNVLGHAGFTLI